MASTCTPVKYNVVSGNGTVTYGWRCAKHKIPSRRYIDENTRDSRMAEHKKDAKSS